MSEITKEELFSQINISDEILIRRIQEEKANYEEAKADLELSAQWGFSPYVVLLKMNDIKARGNMVTILEELLEYRKTHVL